MYQFGYREAACAGWLQPLMALRPTWLFWGHHWQIGLGRSMRRKFAR